MGLRLTNFRRTGQPVLRIRYEGIYISNDISRNTPLEEADVEVKSRVFLPQMTAYFVPQTQRGGCNIKKRLGVTSQLSLNSFVFCGFNPVIRLPDCR